MVSLKWDYRFFALAAFVASWSKDPSTKVGAVIVDRRHRVLGFGYNGFARGVHDSEERYANREEKLKRIVHAEVNAMLNAARTEGCILYCTFCPCAQCASLIVQAGISRVVCRKSPSDERWLEDQKLAKEILIEGGVEVSYI